MSVSVHINFEQAGDNVAWYRKKRRMVALQLD
jgi:hypothetical protein